MTFKTGQQIWVEGEVRSGMFPSERSFKVALPPPDERIISGFASQEFVREPNNGNQGMVAVFVFSKAEKGRVAVLFPGEILTSTNPVRVPFDWLMKQIH
ncbi:hypothetical protein E6H23_02255 [Candidatus Bathyarchaeota archaeon]|nr:MAG: hypothetical protein E6H23_02255 [Candidatus Bathyarchaeota archaeon]